MSPLGRLVLISAAWAAGSTFALAAQQRSLGSVAGFALAALAYQLTRNAPRRGGETKYWRGRPVDDR